MQGKGEGDGSRDKIMTMHVPPSFMTSYLVGRKLGDGDRGEVSFVKLLGLPKWAASISPCSVRVRGSATDGDHTSPTHLINITLSRLAFAFLSCRAVLLRNIPNCLSAVLASLCPHHSDLNPFDPRLKAVQVLNNASPASSFTLYYDRRRAGVAS